MYNESKATGGGSAILPTPAIGGVGLMDDHEKMATIGFKAEGDQIVLLGDAIHQHLTGLGQSLWLREIHGQEHGGCPPVDLNLERIYGEEIRTAILNGWVDAVHDVSDGGVLVALAEMALAANLGAELDFQAGSEFWFTEVQATYLVTTNDLDGLYRKLDPKILVTPLGVVKGQKLEHRHFSIPLTALREASDSFFRDWMES